MSVENSTPDEREQQLDAIIAAYYRAVEAGECIDQKDFIAKYPEVQKELSEFFADLGMFNTASPQDQNDPALEPTITAATSHGRNLNPPEQVRYFGAYEILEELGSGGMGVVYKARHLRLKKIVALKMIRAGAFASELEVKMFEAEARAAAKLDHPGIVTVHEVGLHAGQHFYSMDYVAGGNLSKLHRDEQVPAKRAAELVRQLAEAVHYAHGQGIVHRDLKPANILLTADGVPRITDFGLAKRLWADEDSVALSMSETGQILGTVGYMSPEQADGKTRLVGPPADTYALGAVLYALLTSRAPFVGESQADTIRQVIDREPVSPRVLNPAVPRDLETICLKCLNKDRHNRYGTARLLAEDLSAFLDGRPIEARPLGYIGRTAKWVWRHQVVSSLLVLTCVSMLLGMVFSVYFLIRAEQKSIVAEQERTKATRAKVEADKARNSATRTLAQLQLSDYLNRISLAQAEWHADNIRECEELLDACPPYLRGWEWNHLKQLSRSESTVTIDLRTTGDKGEPLDKVLGHYGLAFSSDGSRVFTKLLKSVEAWDAHTGRHIESIACTGNHFCYDATRNMLLIDGRLVDGTSFRQIRKLQSIETSFQKSTFSTNGTLLAVGTTPILVLNPENGDVLFDLPSTEGGEINSLAFSPSANYLAIARAEALQVWSMESQKVVFSEPRGGAHVSFDGSGQWLISGNLYLGESGNPMAVPDVQIWKVPTFKLVRTFGTDGGGGGIDCRILPFALPGRGNVGVAGPFCGTLNIAVCSSTQQLGVLSWDRSIRLFDLEPMIKWEEQRVSELTDDSAAISSPAVPDRAAMRLRGVALPCSLAFDVSGERLSTVDVNGTLKIWDITHPQEVREYGTDFRLRGNASDLEIQQGDSAVAFATSGGGIDHAHIRVIDVATGSTFDYPEAVIPHNRRFKLCKSGSTLAFTVDGRLHVRSIPGQREIMATDDLVDQSQAFCLDDKGTRLAMEFDWHVTIWDLSRGIELCRIPAKAKAQHNNSTTMLFDPAGKRLTYRNAETKAIEVWDATTARLIAKLPEKGHTELFHGEYLLITRNSDQLTCWSLPRDEPATVQHGEGLMAKEEWSYRSDSNLRWRHTAISDDFSRVAVTKNQTSVTILETRTGKVVREVSVLEGTQFELSPNGSRMIAINRNEAPYLHHIEGNHKVMNLGRQRFDSARF
jgi:serine/threonine protein kinase/WD40 repeat protein